MVRICIFAASITLMMVSISSIASEEEKAPKLRIEEGNYVIENAHYKIIIDKNHGGLLSRLDSQGATVIDWSNIYTDYGIYEPREYVGTNNETSPEINYRQSKGKLEVNSTGYLKKTSEGTIDYPLIQYRITYHFDSSPNIAISCAVKPEFDKQEVLGFLAHPMTLPDISEWFVNTIDGLICETVGTTNQRTWQTTIEPIDDKSPFFGFLTKTGIFIIFSNIKIKAPAPMQNIFFHEGGSGNGRITLFFAWLDSTFPVNLQKGSWYEVSYVLKLAQEIQL